MSVTAELNPASKEAEAKGQSNALGKPVQEPASEQDAGFLSRAFGEAAGEPTATGAARFLGNPTLSHPVNSGLRVISLNRAQQTFGNRFAQRAVTQLRKKSATARSLQRQCSCGGMCAACQGKVADEQEPKLLERQTAQANAAGSPLDANVVPSHSIGQPLDKDTRNFMEPRFGNRFSDVRVHTDSPAAHSADALQADAYATGRDIYFAAGKYAPETTSGQRLLAHELVHTIQQSEGRVGATGGVRGLPLNDDPALEREADDLGTKAARGEIVGRPAAASSGGGNVAQMKADLAAGGPVDSIENSDEESVSLVGEAETPEATAQMKAAGRPIQARAASQPIQRKKEKIDTSVPYQIHVQTPMTREQFRVAAMRQVFGGVVKDIVWRNSKDTYLPANSPYTLLVSTQLLRRIRGEASRGRGITGGGGGGGVAGGEERAKTFQAGAESDQKSALMKEIDRRYFEAVGDKTETKIKPGEKGKAELWRMIRDEVLFQHEYIMNLPPKVKELIKFSIKGKDLTPADYDKLFAIARKIETMNLGQVSDYASKVTGTTTDLNLFEQSLNNYLAEAAAREKQGEERDKVHTKLLGLEAIYQRYRTYRTLSTTSAINSGLGMSMGHGGPIGAGFVGGMEAEKIRVELDAAVKEHGFAGLDDFIAWIRRYEKAFELEAANIAKDVLGKYAGKLFKEQERYAEPQEISALHKNLGGVRTKQAELESGEQEVQSTVRSLPPAGGGGSFFMDRLNKATEKRDTAQKALGAEVSSLGKTSPVFDEEGLPDDKKINKAALAKASEADLAVLVKAQIAGRMSDIGEAKAQIDDKPELIYKMEKLFPQFYAQMGIKPDSIHDMIIQDKMKSDAILKIVKGIAIAIIAIAIAVVSFGTATPAIIAAGAAFAGAGLSLWQAYETYQEYTQEKDLANVGLANDPSVIWLVIAIAGAALDMGAAVNAVGKLGTAAKALEAGGDLKTFMATVAELEKKGELTAQMARAAEKAAAARKGVQEATKGVAKAMLGKAYSFPGPLLDPEVYAAVVKLAYRAIKTKVYDAEKFIAELKIARIEAKLGDLTPQELARAKAAWEEAKALEAADAAARARVSAHVSDAAKLDKLIEQVGDVAALERLLKVFPEAELEKILAQLKDTGRLAGVVDHLGADNAGKIVRQWMEKGKSVKMNDFLDNLVSGAGKELAETTAVSAKSVIIDSQTAIALSKEARGLPLQEGEQLMVNYIKKLPAGTELRVGNVTVGEVGSGVVNAKGLPLELARDSAPYKSMMDELERLKLGGGKGAADRALVADAFFAKTEPGVVPQLATADKNVFNKLATEAGIDLKDMKGQTLSELKPGGFDVTINGQKLHVVPIEPPTVKK